MPDVLVREIDERDLDAQFLLRASGTETLREGEPPCVPSACAGSDGASPSQDRHRRSNLEKDNRSRRSPLGPSYGSFSKYALLSDAATASCLPSGLQARP